MKKEERQKVLVAELAEVARRHGHLSCIPGPWCLASPAGCPPCFEELPPELQEIAKELWGNDPRARPTTR